MAFLFPSSPALNDTYTYNSITWTYNGKGWIKAVVETPSGATVSAGPTAPQGVTDGALWLDDVSGDLYVYSNGNWILSGGGGSSLPAQTSNSGKFLTTNGTVASWGTVSVTPTAVSDQQNTSTGYFNLPSGTTEERPETAYIGATRINTTNNSLEIYSGTEWNTVQYFGYISATGGTVTTLGDYKVHTFLSSSTFSIESAPSNATIEYLVVAGGGGGGSNMGGGGGAGGVLAASNLVVSSGMYAISVGAGGAGAPSGISSPRGTNGGNSAITGSGGSALVTALGGGGGASDYGNATSGGNGGSGGGVASHNSTTIGLGTTGQGNNGGPSGGSYYPGGGGGAGAAGTTNPANGGIGVQNAINGTNYYWGGGGGGAGYSNIAGNGGMGGGGGGGPKVSGGGLGGTGGLNVGLDATPGSLNSQTNVPGGDGGANTGGGGGGGAHYNSNNYGGTGGSGIVIIKYRYQ